MNMKNISMKTLLIALIAAMIFTACAAAQELKPIKLPKPDMSGGKPLMQALKKGDRESYLNQEKLIRDNAGLPPYGRLAAIISHVANNKYNTKPIKAGNIIAMLMN